MAITKTASEVLEKEAALPQYLGELGRSLAKFPPWVAKKILTDNWFKRNLIRRPANFLGQAAWKSVAYPAEWYGKQLYHRPHITVPGTIAAGYGVKYFADNLKKNLIHSDPSVDMTINRPIPYLPVTGRIEYKNQQAAEAAKNYNVLY